LQYATLRQRAGAEYQCAPWPGQHLFGLTDPSVQGVGEDCPVFPKDSRDYDKALFRRLFVPTQSVHYRVTRFIDTLRGRGHTLVGLHLRRGDYGTFTRPSAKWCFVAPTQWYTDWISDHYDKLHDPVFIIASDEPQKVLADFRAYHVATAPDAVPEAPFYADFYALTQCDIMLISNSTFGFTASMLNERAAAFYRPRLSAEALVAYEPWDAPVVFKDEKYA